MMKEGKFRYGSLSMNGIMCNIPSIMGLDMEFRHNAWEGRYYINGEPHPYKRDKIKVKKWTNNEGYTNIWVHEQGGESVSLPEWLVRYGGALDYKDAYRRLEGGDGVDYTLLRNMRQGSPRPNKHVLQVQYEEFAGFDLERCSLFVWMCRMFGEKNVRAVWRRYGATTDYYGNAVFWYINVKGEICYDKVVKYGYDGHRDKSFGGTRRFKTSEGYTERPFFGSNLDFLNSDKVFLVESEKTALIASIAFNGVFLACGGKNAVKDADGLVLLPDRDGADEWRSKGNVLEWWKVWETCGEKSDLGDYIVWAKKNGIGLKEMAEMLGCIEKKA